MGESFELHLAQAKEKNGVETLGDDREYTVVMETAGGTYTIHIYRPSAERYVQQFQKHTWQMQNGKKMTYWLYVPRDYNKEKRYPVILYLHGGSKFKVDALEILTATMQPTAFVKHGLDAIVVVPQANYTTMDYQGEYEKKWAQDDMSKLSPFADEAMRILKYIQERYSVDRRRISVAGISQGGRGTAALILKYPEVFSAGIICAPAVDCLVKVKEGAELKIKKEFLESAQKFARTVKERDIDITLVHAAADPVANIEATTILQEYLEREGVPHKAIIYSSADYLYPTAHFSWVPFFADPKNLEFLVARRR